MVILPHIQQLTEGIEAVKNKINEMGGEVMHVTIPTLTPADEEKTIQSFRQQCNKEYHEIIEECESHFVREVEFERFRKNYTFDAVEEAEQNLEKIRRWYGRIVERDWFHAELQSQARQRIADCQGILEVFEQEVYEKEDVAIPADSPSTE